jgi:hypothetical protein
VQEKGRVHKGKHNDSRTEHVIVEGRESHFMTDGGDKGPYGHTGERMEALRNRRLALFGKELARATCKNKVVHSADAAVSTPVHKWYRCSAIGAL